MLPSLASDPDAFDRCARIYACDAAVRVAKECDDAEAELALVYDRSGRPCPADVQTARQRLTLVRRAAQTVIDAVGLTDHEAGR